MGIMHFGSSYNNRKKKALIINVREKTKHSELLQAPFGTESTRRGMGEGEAGHSKVIAESSHCPGYESCVPAMVPIEVANSVNNFWKPIKWR